jgi:hypothetical protein
MMIMVQVGVSSFAQNKVDMIDILDIRQDISILEDRISKLIKKNPDISHIQNLQQFHIFWLGYEGNTLKEDYLDHSFLYKLAYRYYHIFTGGIPLNFPFLYRINSALYYRLLSKPLFGKGKKYIKDRTLITDSIGNLIASGDAQFISAYSLYGKSDVELAKMFHEKKVDFVFYYIRNHVKYSLYSMISLSEYIAIKDDKIYVIKDTKDGLEIFSMEEFISCCYEE